MAAKSSIGEAGLAPGQTSAAEREPIRRRLSAGAEVQPAGGVHFRVWAPRRGKVEVVLDPPREGRSGEVGLGTTLVSEPGGYFSGYVKEASAATRYRFRLDNLPMLYPDPASRCEDPVFSRQRSDWMHGAVLAPEAFLLRYLTETGDDRLVLVNLGRDFVYSPASEPLIAPPHGADWQLLWSSENPRYGGSGTAPIDTLHWRIQGHAAVVLQSRTVPPA